MYETKMEIPVSGGRGGGRECSNQKPYEGELRIFLNHREGMRVNEAKT